MPRASYDGRDKDLETATIISIVPFRIDESKSGLYPTRYTIPAAKDKKIETLIVREAVCYLYLDHDRGSISIPQSPLKVAKSVVNDWVEALLGVGPDAKPGLLAVVGGYSPETASVNFEDEIKQMHVLQNKWFENLIKLADDDWQRFHQHKMITDLQRYACNALNQEREWNMDVIAEAIIKCPACAINLPASVAVCSACRCVINPEAYKKLVFADDRAAVRTA